MSDADIPRCGVDVFMYGCVAVKWFRRRTHRLTSSSVTNSTCVEHHLPSCLRRWARVNVI